MARSPTLKKRTSLLLLIFLCSAAAIVGPNNGPQSPSFGRSRGFPAPCPGDCFCTSDSVQCKYWVPGDPGDGREGVNIQLPSRTGILALEAIPVKHLDATTTLRGLKELRWLRIYDGELVSVPSLPPLPYLTFLDFSNNRIESVPDRAMNNTPHVVKVDLSGNDLRSISSLAFEGLKDLKELDLSQNPLLTQLPDDLFTWTPRLKFLDLSHTGFVNFTEKWADQLKELHFLNLSYNSISIPPSLHLAELAVLDLSQNPLLHIPTLEHLPRLIKLTVSHSLISYLQVSDTQGCNRLQVLDISHSNLTNLNENILSHCNNLEEIDLSYNLHLWRIEHGAFTGLKNLKILRLNNCPKLYDIEEGALDNLQNLKEIYLQESGVKVLPASMRELKNLTLLNMEGTTLLCDCYARWLPEIMSFKKPAWRGLDIIYCNDGTNRTAVELTEHLEELQCAKVEAYSVANQWVVAPHSQSALLECNVTGNPLPRVIWQTVDQHMHVYNKSMKDHPWVPHQISQVLSIAKAGTGEKFEVLQSGQLLVRNVTRDDIGRYKCFAFNPFSNASVVTFLGLDDTGFRALILESILFGFACAALFLLITLLIQFIKFIMERLGWECCCFKDRLSPKAKQIWQLIESVETYKSAQLEKLRENYNSQVASIKDSCYQQMERLRESYAHQSKNLKDLCDYSTQQITGARDQYLDQVNRIRDYSIGQMNRVRENYVFQRHRIRKFSGHQLLRLRETYKYQQKTLNKLLETLPDLYIQNCRTGSCQRTDSIVFDDELVGLDAYYKIDFLDAQSYSSDYYTPNSTLTRQSRVGRMTHSRAPSSASGGTEYQEAHSWITRQESLGSDRSSDNQKVHTRSFSITVPPSGGPHRKDSFRGHKRSISASSHPSPQLFHPKPPLLEEIGDYTPPLVASPKSETPKSNRETPLYTPLLLTPVHDSSNTFASLGKTKEELGVNMPNDECESLDSKKDQEEDNTPTEELLSSSDHAVQNCVSDCDRGDSEGEECDNMGESKEPVRNNNKTVSYETSL